MENMDLKLIFALVRAYRDCKKAWVCAITILESDLFRRECFEEDYLRLMSDSRSKQERKLRGRMEKAGSPSHAT